MKYTLIASILFTAGCSTTTWEQECSATYRPNGIPVNATWESSYNMCRMMEHTGTGPTIDVRIVN